MPRGRLYCSKVMPRDGSRLFPRKALEVGAPLRLRLVAAQHSRYDALPVDEHGGGIAAEAEHIEEPERRVVGGGEGSGGGPFKAPGGAAEGQRLRLLAGYPLAEGI